MKIIGINSSFQFKKSILRLGTLIFSQVLLFGCGGGKGDAAPKGASGPNNSVSAMSSPLISSSSAQISSESSISVSSSASSISSLASSHSSNGASIQIDASQQFSSVINEKFYLFKNTSDPQTLFYLPKYLALSSFPGVASVQYANKVSNLLKVFLDLSDSDWASANQITFSSKYTLDVDLEQLRQESETAGYTKLADLKVKPPVMMLEQRHNTSVPPARILIQCKNLTLLINSNEVTLYDCNLVDADGIITPQSVNNIGGFRYESLNFDPDAISGNNSLRGTFNIDYTLPGTREFDRILSTNSGNLASTWQLYFNWPLTHTSVSSSTVTVNWKELLASLNEKISAGETRWDENAINTFASSAVKNGIIVLPTATDLTWALNSTIVNYLKQELFIAIYNENGFSPLMWVPKLRFKNIDQLNSQQIVFRYFDSDLPLVSKLDLSCLSKPDVQNNLYKLTNCEK